MYLEGRHFHYVKNKWLKAEGWLVLSVLPWQELVSFWTAKPLRCFSGPILFILIT